jgi:two-component system LytT family response regulator
VKEGTKVHVIPADRLDYAEAEDDYVSLHSEGKSYLKQQTISSLESALDPRQFVRIHRSYLVNQERVARIEPYAKESRVAVLTDGTQLPVSRAGYDRLKALLDAPVARLPLQNTGRDMVFVPPALGCSANLRITGREAGNTLESVSEPTP